MFLTEVKEYLNVDEDDDYADSVITSSILASKVYLKNAGVKVSEENDLYKLVLKMMTSHFFNDRSGEGGKKNPSFSLSLNSLITQLACGDKNEV